MTFSYRIAARNFAIGLIGASALFLAACETARDPQLLSNPNYSSGYADGCQSAQTRVNGFDDSITRNNLLAETEPAYEIGWRDGYAACGGSNLDSSDGSTREIFRRGSEHYTTTPY